MLGLKKGTAKACREGSMMLGSQDQEEGREIVSNPSISETQGDQCTQGSVGQEGKQQDPLTYVRKAHSAGCARQLGGLWMRRLADPER